MNSTLCGLSHRFTLQNGAFSFSQDVEKAGDDVRFVLAFYAKTRVYAPDFSPGLLWVVQRPTTTVDTFSTLILGRLKKAFTRYIPAVTIAGLSLDRVAERRSYALSVNYSYKGSPENNTVQFL
jgi:hypothetical protein